MLINQLPDSLSNIEITANWEKVLSDVAKGKESYKSFIEGIQTTLNDNISILKNMAGKVDKIVENPCPKCGENLVRIKKKTSGFFWGCSGHRVSGCTVTMDDNRGKPRPRKEFPISDINCPKCKKNKLSQRMSKNNKPYWGCSGFPDCKAIFYDNNGNPQI
jgi:ssDNA-binding Zn-finger/Zn-ribbon topoisomerase 1